MCPRISNFPGTYTKILYEKQLMAEAFTRGKYSTAVTDGKFHFVEQKYYMKNKMK